MMFKEKKFNKLEEILNYNDKYESKLALPNSIFKDLLQLVKDKKLKTAHVGFAYSYIYLETFLYRYAKYSNYVPRVSGIKGILGYNGGVKGLDYIIKRNGLLEQEKILTTTSDFPIDARFEDSFDGTNGLTITTLSMLGDDEYSYSEQFRESRGINRNQTCKYPVFGFYTDKEPMESGVYSGTFYHSENTHIIDFKVFNYCMANEELGVNGFYLFAYLKHKNDIFKDGYNATAKRLSNETGLTERTIKRYLDALRAYRVIEGIPEQDYFVLGLDEKERKANRYITNSYDDFFYKRMEYMKMKTMSLEKYGKMKKELGEINLLGS